ncbi:MAG TPA: hypothetical protein VF697_17080, partial [Archangium sp.]
MKKSLLLLAATAAVSGCYSVENAKPSGVGSFRVLVQSINAVNGSGAPQALDVVPSCIKRYGTATEQVPPEVRGTEDCRYIAPNGPVEMTLDITALDKNGQPFDFNEAVAFQVEPGRLTGTYKYHWTTLTKGRGIGKVRAEFLYGEVRVWVKDERFEPTYVDGGILYHTDAGSADPEQFPKEPDTGRSYAAGASAPVFFAEPTLASIQRPQVPDNRSSPFVGQFVTIGRAPESGSVLYQNCPDIDVDKDGKVDVLPPKPVTLLVTGTDPSGFYVTDMTACRVPDPTEPSGYLPGTFGSMYVYNYSFPEGLDPGDLLWTLAGSLQEFTSTTQLTFPSWSVREHVRELPPEQWNKYLNLNPPVELNLRHCGLPDSLSPGPVDKLCGFYNDNMKLESLESALVKVHHVRFP